MRVGLILVLAAGCSIPEKHLTDAGGSPYGCLGKPLPTMANVKVTVAGTVADPFTGNFVSNASVEGFLVGVPTPIFMTTTDASGAFTHDQGTGGVPRDAYLKLSQNGFLDTYFYPSAPIVRDLTEPLQMLTTTDLMTIASIGQVTVDPAKAQLLITVIDCNGAPVAGATVTTTPAGTIRYFVAGTPSVGATATDAMTGSAYIANVPVSNTTVNAMVSGMTLRSHNFDSVAGAIMGTEIQP